MIKDFIVGAIAHICLWFLFCVIFSVIMYCFGMEFSWKVSTGAYIALWVLRAFVGEKGHNRDKEEELES